MKIKLIIIFMIIIIKNKNYVTNNKITIIIKNI